MFELPTTTEKDYASKEWLGREDAFQLIPPDVAGALLIAGFFLLIVLERLGLL